MVIQTKSQILDKQPHDIIGEQMIGDTVLDRIVHHSLMIELYGELLRK